MAATDYPLNHPLAVKHWAPGLMKEALKKTHALQFMGKDTNSLIQIKTELNKAAGDRVRFGLRQQLNGAGIQGDNTLEGNEEDLVTYYKDVIIDQLRHAVRSAGKMSEQRVPFSVREEGKDGLADWWADRMDTAFFNQLCGATGVSDVRYTGMQATIAPDSDHLVVAAATGSTSEDSLSNTSVAKFNLNFIDIAVEKAKLAVNAMRPISINNERKYVMFLHPYQVTDLRTNTSTGQWLDIQKAAMSGGQVSKSPIYTGALGEYNNVILHESTRIPTGLVNASARRAVLCGAQAGSIAFGRGYGKNVFEWVEEMFDFKNQLGVAAGCIWGLQKNRFNNSDFATVVVPTYAASHG